MSRASRQFSAVHTEGGLLPQDLLARIQAGDPGLPGTQAEAYHLGPHERIGEAANRAWSRLVATWRAFREALDKEPETSLATGLTRDRWLLPLFQELGYGRLPKATAVDVEGKSFAVSHVWHRSPIHLLGCRIDLDRRQKGVAGAARSSPHGLVQELLNRSDDHLWGFVSNGYGLRVLRDHHSLTRQAYVEFDLQAIMDGEQYSEFLLLWLVCHQSRVEADKPEECWLETWASTSRDEGVRALDKLRDGVEKAIESFGTGFLAHRANTQLRDALESGELDKQEYYRQVLRLVYRLIFLFVAEERDALLDPSASEEARERYRRYYTTRRLRELADKRRGGAHGDLWRGLALVMERLNDGYPALGLPALGSRLWGPAACSWLMGAECANEHVLAALRRLSYLQEGRTRFPVNWRNVGADELGSIYESLLELHPRINREAGTFELDTAAGHERKTTGSYYTPTSLVDCLLDSALDPVLDEACGKADPEQAILDLKVCDPACGSGHFLVAAARRIAKRLAAVRSGDEEPSPRDVQRALRDVVGRCVYGVDLNPMAVELCKVSLWMEAIEPGKPLSFLDSHVQCGNALLGATPALMARGIPDAAFKPIEGDDKEVAKRLRKRNRVERKGQTTLFGLFAAESGTDFGAVASGADEVERAADDSIGAVRKKERRWDRLARSAEYRDAWFAADAWCAAFVWPKQAGELEDGAVTCDAWRRIERDASAAGQVTRRTVRELAREYRFFHWQLAFPQVFLESGEGRVPDSEEAGWSGGFGAVLGNPPYGKLPSARKPGRGLCDAKFSDAWDSTNLANLFIPVGLSALRTAGRLAFVFPKSLTYVGGYSRTRGAILRHAALDHVVDLGRAFEAVGLEQIVFALSKASGATVRDAAYWSHTLVRGIREPVAHTPLAVTDDLGTWPLYLDKRNAEILARVREHSVPLRRYCMSGSARAVFRGVGFQSKKRYHTDGPGPNALPLLGGRNITKYVVWSRDDEPYVFCNVSHPDLVADEKIDRQRTRRIACKNVVSSDVKVEATILEPNQLTLDTINNIAIDPAAGVPLEYIVAVLNSRLSAWFLREVLFNRSGLTMHLDERYLGAVPIPVWRGEEWQQRVVQRATALLARPARKFRKGVTNLEEVQLDLVAELDDLLERALGLDALLGKGPSRR